jgi:hypothetical protein
MTDKLKETNTAKIFKRTKKLLASIAKKQGMPMHYNSIMICINWMTQLVGPKVDYKLNDLDDEKIFKYFERHTWKTLFYYPPEKEISKIIFAAFISTLDSSLVDTKETPVSFAETLFSLYDDDIYSF